MNFSIPLGIALGCFLIFSTLKEAIENFAVLASPHAALIVVGGTFAATLICFPLGHILNLIRIFINTVRQNKNALFLETITEIVRLSELLNEDRPLNGELKKIKNPFLKESLELLEGGGLTREELEDVLNTRVELQNERYKRDGMTFKIIGKFPPAFGLVGTTIGMISLLQSLGQKDAFTKLGPSMAISLVATLYGLVFANLFLIPIGENLNQASEDDLVMRRIVVEGVRLLRDRKHPLLVSEYLKSYMNESERRRLKNVAK